MKTLGAAVLTSLALLPVRWQPGVTATNDPKTETVVDASGNLRLPGNYRTAYQSLGSWAVAVAKEIHVVYASPGTIAAYGKNGHFAPWGRGTSSSILRCRQPFKDDVDRLQGGLSPLP